MGAAIDHDGEATPSSPSPASIPPPSSGQQHPSPISAHTSLATPIDSFAVSPAPLSANPAAHGFSADTVQDPSLKRTPPCIAGDAPEESTAVPTGTVDGLAQNQYFEDQDFIAYLSYLQYWLLQEAAFREAFKRQDYTLFVHQQQGYYWQFRRTMTPRENWTMQPANVLSSIGGGAHAADEGATVEVEAAAHEGGAHMDSGTTISAPVQI